MPEFYYIFNSSFRWTMAFLKISCTCSVATLVFRWCKCYEAQFRFCETPENVVELERCLLETETQCVRNCLTLRQGSLPWFYKIFILIANICTQIAKDRSEGSFSDFLTLFPPPMPQSFWLKKTQQSAFSDRLPVLKIRESLVVQTSVAKLCEWLLKWGQFLSQENEQNLSDCWI